MKHLKFCLQNKTFVAIIVLVKSEHIMGLKNHKNNLNRSNGKQLPELGLVGAVFNESNAYASLSRSLSRDATWSLELFNAAILVYTHTHTRHPPKEQSECIVLNIN